MAIGRAGVQGLAVYALLLSSFAAPHSMGKVPLDAVSQVQLFQLQLSGADESTALTNTSVVTLNWQLTSRSPENAEGQYVITLDDGVVGGRPAQALVVAAGAQVSGTFSMGPFAPGEHVVNMRFDRFVAGTHLERLGPSRIVQVRNRELAAQGFVRFTVSAPAPEAIACNGDAGLCDRRYDEVSYATTHNSFVNGDENWNDPAQGHGLRRQLDDGIRALMLDAHEKDGVAYLCHDKCWWGLNIPASDNPTFASGLVQVREFLVANPHEVVTIFIESDVTADQLEAAFAQAGLLSLVYTFGMGPAPAPGMPTEKHWATLRQMIALDRRLVVLVDEDHEAQYAWQHYEYRYNGQTSYRYVTSTGDIATDCAIDRGIEGYLFTINHFLELPHDSGYGQINAFDFMNQRAERCRQDRGHIVNFLAVNHYESSAVLNVVLKQNGLL